MGTDWHDIFILFHSEDKRTINDLYLLDSLKKKKGLIKKYQGNGS